MTAATPAPTASLTTPVHLTISGECSCRYCPICLTPFFGPACECGDEGFPGMECQGCMQEAYEHVGAVARQWYQANPSAPERGWDVSGGAEAMLRGGSGAWEQRWLIEPWTGGRMLVEVLVDGVQVGCLTVLP